MLDYQAVSSDVCLWVVCVPKMCVRLKGALVDIAARLRRTADRL